MTNDLETMLRTSLHERADDVEPTPELWQQVQRRIARRRAMPLLVWTAAGVAAAVTAVAVVPGLVDRMDEGFVIDPAQSPTAPAPPGEVVPGPVAGAPLTHYVAVVDGRLVLRGLDGSEQVLWEGESEVRTVAVQPGSTPEDLTVAFVTESEGFRDLRIVGGVDVVPTSMGSVTDEGAPTPVWSPDGSTIAWVEPSADGTVTLQLLDFDSMGSERQLAPWPIVLGDETAGVRLQDWTEVLADQRLLLTAQGRLLELTLRRTEGGWERGALHEVAGGDDVVDIATGEDGTQYRLIAGDSSSGDAEDAGSALEFDDHRIPFPDLPTASPADLWMTAVEGGAIVGLGSEARLVLRHRESDVEVTRVAGLSYAAWVPGSAADVGATTAPSPADTMTDGPRADGPLSASGVIPYAAVDEAGRLAVHTGDGGEREVILDEQLWSPQAGVRVLDASVRPGSSPGEVAGVALLATEGGAELLWFRAAAGATATARMEGATGLGTDGLGQRDAPTWSPDGRHIAWVEPSEDGGWTLRTVGMADDGPTTADAGFGIEAPGSQSLQVAAWVWDESTDGTARGRLLLVDDEETLGAGYVLPIERQGDGALAVTGPAAPLPGSEVGSVTALGERDGSLVLLVRSGDGWIVSQDAGETSVPLPFESGAGDLDLDVLEHVSVVTQRRTGQAYVVDRAGGVAPLEADAATTYGFDPVR